MKRAISLAGGGPAVGLHLGVLKKLAEADMKFEVWALSCIGAWAGVVYNQFGGTPIQKAQQTYEFFKGIFQDDETYSAFPTNTVFPPDLRGNLLALVDFISNPTNYQHLLVTKQWTGAMHDTLTLLRNRGRWNEGDLYRWVLRMTSINPAARFLTSLVWQSKRSGLTRMYYKQADLLSRIDFRRLNDDDQPLIYHNAWNLSQRRIELFANKAAYGHHRLDARSLCACSALPFIEETVEINGDIYCEGALVHTVNLENLLEDHPDLNEIWVVRIIDVSQARPHENLNEALGNLMMLFAGALGEERIKLFKYQIRDLKWPGRLVEVNVSTKINFDWSRSNLDLGVSEGYAAAAQALKEVKWE